MTDPADISRKRFDAAELHPYVDRAEADGLEATAERLIAEQPVPRAGFRADLKMLLIERGAGRPVWRPQRLRVMVASYVGSGAALVAVAAVGLAGVGPLS